MIATAKHYKQTQFPLDDLVGEVKIEGEDWDVGEHSDEEKFIKLISRLEKDMSVEEAIKILGAPNIDREDNEKTLIYQLNDTSIIELEFSPGLKSVKQKMEGANMDLLYMEVLRSL